MVHISTTVTAAMVTNVHHSPPDCYGGNSTSAKGTAAAGEADRKAGEPVVAGERLLMPTPFVDRLRT